MRYGPYIYILFVHYTFFSMASHRTKVTANSVSARVRLELASKLSIYIREIFSQDLLYSVCRFRTFLVITKYVRCLLD